MNTLEIDMDPVYGKTYSDVSCGSADSTIQDLPVELFIHVMSYLDLHSLSNAATVARVWQHITGDKRNKALHAVWRMQKLIFRNEFKTAPLSLPYADLGKLSIDYRNQNYTGVAITSETNPIHYLINNKDSDAPLCFIKNCGRFLGSLGECDVFVGESSAELLFISRENLREVVRLNVRSALTQAELQNEHLYTFQSIIAFFPLTSSTFLTITKAGTFSFWEIEANNIRCVEHNQCFDTPQDFTAQWLRKAHKIGDFLFMECTFNDIFFSIYQYQISTLRHLYIYDHNHRIAANRHRFYHLNRVGVFSYSVNAEEKNVVQDEGRYYFPQAENGEKQTQMLAAVSDDWVALSATKPRTTGVRTTITLLDQQLKFVHEFEKNCHVTLDYFEFRSLDYNVKIFGNFLAFYVRDFLQVWDIPSKVPLKEIQLKKIGIEDAIIKKVRINEDELIILYYDENNKSLRILSYILT